MSKIQVPTRDQVDEKSQAIFDQLKANLGTVPNLYATIGYSSNALENLLSFSQKAGSEVFSAKEIEVIKLSVSEANNCAYCKAAHTALAKMNGFTDEETLAIRRTDIEDSKLRMLASLAQEVAKKAGKVDETSRDAFFALGYDEKALIEFVSVVVAVTFTNYVHGITAVPVDFPLAEDLEVAAV